MGVGLFIGGTCSHWGSLLDPVVRKIVGRSVGRSRHMPAERHNDMALRHNHRYALHVAMTNDPTHNAENRTKLMVPEKSVLSGPLLRFSHKSRFWTTNTQQPQHQHTMFGKHTNTVLALAAFVSLGVLMPDMSGTTRKLSAEQEVR